MNASLVKDYFLLDPTSYAESSLTTIDTEEMKALDYSERLCLAEPSSRGGYSDVCKAVDNRTKHTVVVCAH